MKRKIDEEEKKLRGAGGGARVRRDGTEEGRNLTEDMEKNGKKSLWCDLWCDFDIVFVF